MDEFDRNHGHGSPDSPDIDIDDTPSCTSDDDDDDDIDDDDDNNAAMRDVRKQSLAPSRTAAPSASPIGFRTYP